VLSCGKDTGERHLFPPPADGPGSSTETGPRVCVDRVLRSGWERLPGTENGEREAVARTRHELGGELGQALGLGGDYDLVAGNVGNASAFASSGSASPTRASLLAPPRADPRLRDAVVRRECAHRDDRAFNGQRCNAQLRAPVAGVSRRAPGVVELYSFMLGLLSERLTSPALGH
jgi:hypothetical protein